MKLKKGLKTSVSGRFIPESEMDSISKGIVNLSYPQITFDGIITQVNEKTVYVDFDSFEMEIPNEDLGFAMKYRYTLGFISEVRNNGVNDHKLFSYYADTFIVKSIPKVISTTPNYIEHKDDKGFIDLNELPIYEFNGQNIALYEVISNLYDFTGEIELIDSDKKSIILEIRKSNDKYYAQFKRFED